jgi:hypothetical protein
MLVVRHQVIPHDMQVMAHQLANYLAHGDHDPALQHQAPAQLEAVPLDRQAAGSIVEQLGLQLLHGVIQALDRLELAIDDVIQQPVQEVADPQLDQVGIFVPALDDRADVETVVSRTVISAWRVMKAASSLVASSPAVGSSRAP